MLHIILLILKIIGFLLLGIIALLLILAASVILTPLVYKAELSADNSLESIKGRIHFHWLFHLLEGNLTYKDGEFEWRIRAAWKKFGNGESSKTTFSQAGRTSGIPEEWAETCLNDRKQNRAPRQHRRTDQNRKCAREAAVPDIFRRKKRYLRKRTKQIRREKSPSKKKAFL